MHHTPSTLIPHPSSLSRRAFTLVELMVSIAIALLLLVGINTVFKTTTDTVGTGYATSLAMRQRMAVDRTFDHAFASAVYPSEQPFILIHSQQQYAFMDHNDLNNDRDADVTTVDLDGNGKEGETGVYGEVVRPGNYGTRSHRIDTLSFFARDVENPFHRLTGDHNPNTGFVSNEYSPEAFLWLGHLRLPRNTRHLPPSTGDLDPLPYNSPSSGGDYFIPGQRADTITTTPAQDLAANQNNYLVSDWALGQQAILLKNDPAGNYIEATDLSSAGSLAERLEPIGATSSSKNQDSTYAWQIRHSRFDIAATTISDYRDRIQTVSDPNQPTYDTNWYLPLDYRFNAKPWINKLDPNSMSQTAYMQAMTREMALTTPFMFRGCSQFIVEFAGDFVTQDATTGKVTAAKPDGVTDYVLFSTSPNEVRRTRWYGFPRDVDGPISSSNKKPSEKPDGKINVDYDVVPVRDVLSAVGLGVPANWFEKILPSASAQADYLAKTALVAGAEYVCAWSPDQLDPTKDTQYMPPTMIRIVMQLTDPQGRLGEGPVSEFVYKFGE